MYAILKMTSKYSGKTFDEADVFFFFFHYFLTAWYSITSMYSACFQQKIEASIRNGMAIESSLRL